MVYMSANILVKAKYFSDILKAEKKQKLKTSRGTKFSWQYSSFSSIQLVS